MEFFNIVKEYSDLLKNIMEIKLEELQTLESLKLLVS